MRIKPLNRFASQSRFFISISKILANAPLRTVLIVPFMLQTVVTVGLVGYLSFRNGQKAVKDLTSQLRSELTTHIKQQLEGYVKTPVLINQLNVNALARGEIDIINTKGEDHFWQQAKLFPSTSFVYCGSEQGGELFGVSRGLNKEQELQVAIANSSTGHRFYYYGADSSGNRTSLIEKGPATYDARSRPWYKVARTAGGPTWSEIYLDFAWLLPTITASMPVYDRTSRSLIGVCATDLFLPKEFSKFLRSLKIGRSGQTFVIERSGVLVSSSTREPLTSGSGKNTIRLKAWESSNPLVRGTGQYLSDRFGDLTKIQSPQQLDFQLNGKRQLVQVTPFQDGRSLDWLIVVVVPESDFMEQINANTRTTVLLCIAALIAAVGIGILTAQWIAEPIIRLNFAAKDVAQGEWNKTVNIYRSDEVGELAKSFNSMAEQLKGSFENLETQKNSFARFVPLEYLKFLSKDSILDVQLGDHVSKEMAMMFSDIRSFTTLSESMTPQESFDFVNVYLQSVSPEIRNHNGFIVKYLGDGIMAAFPEGADDAVQAGVAQLKKVQEYNWQREKEGYLPIEIGIGIHVGHIMVGMVGEANRIQGDALSDNVNLTARLEGLTKFYGVSLLISEQVLKGLNDSTRYNIRFLDRATVKGRTEPIAIYEVLDGEIETSRKLKLQTQPNFEQGLKYYCHQELAKAQACFMQVATINPLDKTAQLYLERIEQLMKQGVPANWNGVWAFTQK